MRGDGLKALLNTKTTEFRGGWLDLFLGALLGTSLPAGALAGEH